VVVAGTVEGFLGRGAIGGTVTYNRRFVSRPRGYDRINRPAITVSLDGLPRVPGAYWTLKFDGHLNTYRMIIDSSTTNCSTYVPGKVTLAAVPQYRSSTATTPVNLTFPWTALTLFPGYNAVIPVVLGGGVDNNNGLVTYQDGAICYY
jgi:hypothetical protein